MKIPAISAALGVMTLTLSAATLTPVEVGSPAINCLYNPACTNQTEDSSIPITLPGTTGTGFLRTRVIWGEAGAPAEGLFGYEYSIDLSGLALDPSVPQCSTNFVQCITNRLHLTNEVVVCHTNGPGMFRAVICVTNMIPATNVVTCITNSLFGTNVVQCFTDAAGMVTCFTNDFEATDYVRCFTNHVRAKTFISCQTNVVMDANPIVTCRTNEKGFFTNILTCTTNIIPCPWTAPCVEELRINFGPIITRLDFDTNGSSMDQAYVVTSGGSGTIAPGQITRNKREVVIRFAQPICPGDSSFAVGLLSAHPPGDVLGALTLTSSSNGVVVTRGPQSSGLAGCDFTALGKSIDKLSSRELLGANAQTRESHRKAMLAQVNLAAAAAKAGNLEDLLGALAMIMIRTDGGSDDWVTSNAAGHVNQVMGALLDCLEGVSTSGDKDDDDDDRDRDGHQHSGRN